MARAPRRLGEGDSPAISPKGDLVAFVQHGQIWMRRSLETPPPGRPSARRGECEPSRWSPDGARLAFVSQPRRSRASSASTSPSPNTLRFIDPSTDRDEYPVWSPDSRSIAFIREPSSGLRAVRQAPCAPASPGRFASPPSRPARAAKSGAPAEGPGSVFRRSLPTISSSGPTGNRLVFPWEARRLDASLLRRARRRRRDTPHARRRSKSRT